MTKRKSNPLISNSIFRWSHYSICLFPKGNSLNKCVVDYNSTLLSRKTTPFSLSPPPPMLQVGLIQSHIQLTSICKLHFDDCGSCNHYTPLTNPFTKGYDTIPKVLDVPRRSMATAVLVILELQRDPSCLLSCYIQLELNRDLSNQTLVLLTHRK